MALTRLKNELTILWRGADLLAVDKPSGLSTIPGRGETESLLERLSRQLGVNRTGDSDPRLRIVHRLDKGTSGVVLLATAIESQRQLSAQFQNNLISKEYLALVAGRVLEESGVVDLPIAPHPTAPKRMAVVKHGRAARTEWEVVERFRDYSLLRVRPRTGRTHQIRVHLLAAGMPLAIDPLYNPRTGNAGLLLSRLKRRYRPSRRERPLISRLTLHAHSLQFHDQRGNPVYVEAPLPKDLRAALNMLHKYGRT
ncbi:MAG: RluA family pseudouridine synthase [Tepidisphaeraceae bacterium]